MAPQGSLDFTLGRVFNASDDILDKRDDEYISCVLAYLYRLFAGSSSFYTA